MENHEGILITVKCEKCGNENRTIIPVEISEENWIKPKKKINNSRTKEEIGKFKKNRHEILLKSP